MQHKIDIQTNEIERLSGNGEEKMQKILKDALAAKEAELDHWQMKY
jgi:hypothetical protein